MDTSSLCGYIFQGFILTNTWWQRTEYLAAPPEIVAVLSITTFVRRLAEVTSWWSRSVEGTAPEIDPQPSLPPTGGEDHGKAEGGIVVRSTVGFIAVCPILADAKRYTSNRGTLHFKNNFSDFRVTPMTASNIECGRFALNIEIDRSKAPGWRRRRRRHHR